MRTITRGVVHIEQCDNCKGVFLDGGELEQIVAAERDHYAAQAVPPYSPDQQSAAGAPPPYSPDPAGSPPPYPADPGSPGGSPPPYQPPPGTVAPAPVYPPGAVAPPVYPPGYYNQGYPGHRRRSFLEELLD